MPDDPPRGAVQVRIFDSVVRMIAGAILHSHEVAEKVGLGPSDAQFLTLLQVHGPLTPGRLAELSGLTSGTVTGVVDRLERAGYARRDRSSDDRRRVVVSRVEEKVRHDMGPLYEGYGQALHELLGRYDDEQLAVIADFTARLAHP
ncbi:MarR family transcriptional regulator [Frankia sp. AgPm24]|uniref:MarR family transcriptional regulator n=1 Tax=Frankia umida TaxID=573489 RepID=A0ABT0JZW7_9ACTN|nr:MULTISPECIES: MarR family transcriptional regulator [Frankia]MCK9877026.1 MarR family transcriptional regulator [Frankia umida]MCK9921818.1 MarR family transcriptional regulator [Frankia sp. AgPm24]